MSDGNGVGRIWRTADGSYVGDGHPLAAVLAAGVADPLPADFDPELFNGGTVAVVEPAVEVKPAVHAPAAKRGKK